MLFLPFKPMEPVAAQSLPAGEAHYFQVKWDGVRILAHAGVGRVLLYNRKMKERTFHYPELVFSLSKLLQKEAVLDGEVVALREGLPDFQLLLTRDLLDPGADGSKLPPSLIAKTPVYYMVFDILFWGGREIKSLPLTERSRLLRGALQENETVRIVDSHVNGRSLLEAVQERSMEGVLAKEKNSLYYPGEKRKAWVKVKVRRKQLVVIGGFTAREGLVNALLVGVYCGGKLVYAGRVGSGLKQEEWRALSSSLPDLRRDISPFAGEAPRLQATWVEPVLTALVEFQEWTGKGRLRAPVIKGFVDKDAKACRCDASACYHG